MAFKTALSLNERLGGGLVAAEAHVQISHFEIRGQALVVRYGVWANAKAIKDGLPPVYADQVEMPGEVLDQVKALLQAALPQVVAGLGEAEVVADEKAKAKDQVDREEVDK